jgi:4-hydroxybenzoate polyprenyltransferase
MHLTISMIKHFIRTHIFISLCASSYYLFLSPIINYYNLIFIFFSTLTTYKYLTENKLNYLTIIPSLLTFYFIDHHELYIIGAILTFLYKYKIRSIWYLKPLCIGICWSILAKLTGPYTFISSLLFIISLSIPYDIRQMSSDNFKTIPKVLGIYKTKLLCVIIWTFFVFLGHNIIEAHHLLIMSSIYLICLFKIQDKSSPIYSHIFLDGLIFYLGLASFLKQI